MSYARNVIAMAVATFLVTLVVLSRQEGLWPWRQSAGYGEPTTPIAVTPQKKTNIWPTQITSTPAPETHPTAPAPRPSAGEPQVAATATSGSPETVPTPRPLPVSVFFTKQADGSGGIAAHLRNSSSETLDLTITATNAATGKDSQVQLTVPGSANVDLIEAGVLIEHGDDIKIASAAYD